MERQTVSSRQNPLVKFVCGLSEKKRRNEHELFRFDGVKLLAEAIASELKIKYVICREPVSEAVSALVESAIRGGLVGSEGIVYVTDGVFEKLSEERSPEGVITVAHFLDSLYTDADKELPPRDRRLLIAESVRDPGNLGTVIRSAYALGIEELVLTDDCADV